MRITYEPVVAQDFEAMLALRMEALRPSLTRLGRWNPEFSRGHFEAAFEPTHMRHIVVGAERVGFYTLLPHADDWMLRHLYLDACTRGKGVGSQVIRHVQQTAAQHGKVIVLEALQHSDSNRFYVRHGFVKIGEDAIDVFYRWEPSAQSQEGL